MKQSTFMYLMCTLWIIFFFFKKDTKWPKISIEFFFFFLIFPKLNFAFKSYVISHISKKSILGNSKDSWVNCDFKKLLRSFTLFKIAKIIYNWIWYLTCICSLKLLWFSSCYRHVTILPRLTVSYRYRSISGR